MGFGGGFVPSLSRSRVYVMNSVVPSVGSNRYFWWALGCLFTFCLGQYIRHGFHGPTFTWKSGQIGIVLLNFCSGKMTLMVS